MATKQVAPKPVKPVVIPPIAKPPLPTSAEKLQAFLDKENIEVHADAMGSIEKIMSPDGKRITGYILREPPIKVYDK